LAPDGPAADGKKGPSVLGLLACLRITVPGNQSYWNANLRGPMEACGPHEQTEAEMEAGRLEELVAQLGDADGGKRQRARETLAVVGDPAVPSLVALLGSPQVRVRWEAAKALTEIPAPAALSGLVSLLADPESEIRWLAAIGLINLGNRSVPQVLEALIEHVDSKGFRDASHHVLHDLSRRNGVLGDVLKPVLAVLGDTDPAGVISSRAEAALVEFRVLVGD
jgi:HEAT repeat protein